MANNTMFGSLRRYRQDLSFIDESPFIDLSSNYEDYQYVIFGLTITSGNWYTDFRYWDMEELDNEEDFNYYVDTIKAGSMVDTGVDVQYGDKLLTLSTCYSDEDNSRFLVVARRLRDDETPNDISSIARTEEYIKAQQGAEADEESEDASGEQQDSESSTDADGSGDNAQ
jgi:sortase B